MANRSVDGNGLQAPYAPSQGQRRQSLSLPQGPAPQPGRPPSPLRHGFVPDTSTGINPDMDDDDDDEDDRRHWQMRSPSPASSVSQFAASFANKVGSLVSGMSAPRSPGYMPTDAELEAEAERERDRSRREAERILTREAHDRKLVEDRVLEMLESSKALPPPPARSQTLGLNPPSPTTSQKEKDGTNWWTAAKNRLTPTKDKDRDLTPAQQVIQETKVREKEKEKERKNGKGKEREWAPETPERKYADSAYLSSLNSSPTAIPGRRPAPPSPSSPTPLPRNHLPPDLTPPRRPTDSTVSSSPSSKEAIPVYAQFDATGALDVHVTLLTIAKRFEKLEKWTVGHVRALEERMGDVERWLVEKESQKDKDDASVKEDVNAEVSELRDELHELQSRMTEMGREMARMATAPANLSSAPSLKSAEVTSQHAYTSSSVAEHHTGGSHVSTPSRDRYLPPTARVSTSPPMLSSSKFSVSSRLPYPSGDYATPPDSNMSPGRPTSPLDPRSTQPLSIAGLPSSNSVPSSSNSHSGASFSSPSLMSPSGLPRTGSPTSYSPSNRSPSVAGRPLPASGSGTSLNAREKVSSQKLSGSPTPTPKNRKRYTVALGGPIVPPPGSDDEKPKAVEEDDDDSEFADETIGKKGSAAAKRSLASANFNTSPRLDSYRSPSFDKLPSASPPDGRVRAQSTWGPSGALQTPLDLTMATITTPTAPLNPGRLRSRSTERLFSNAADNAAPQTGPNLNKFVDPLVLKRQQDVSKAVGGKVTGKKVPVGDLVKFFDGDRR